MTHPHAKCKICGAEIYGLGHINNVRIDTAEANCRKEIKEKHAHLCKLCYLPIWTYIWGNDSSELCDKLGWDINWKDELKAERSN